MNCPNFLLIFTLYMLIHKYIHIYTPTGIGKHRFTVVPMENNMIVNDNARINSVFCVLTTVNLLWSLLYMIYFYFPSLGEKVLKGRETLSSSSL